MGKGPKKDLEAIEAKRNRQRRAKFFIKHEKKESLREEIRKIQSELNDIPYEAVLRDAASRDKRSQLTIKLIELRTKLRDIIQNA